MKNNRGVLLLRLFFVLFLIVFVLMGLSFALLNSGWFYTKVLPRAISSANKDLQIQTFEPARYSFRFPLRFHLEDIKCLAKIHSISHKISCRQLSLEGISTHQFKNTLTDLAVETPIYKIKNFNVNLLMDLDKKGIRQLDGTLNGAQATAYGYETNWIISLMKGDKEKIWFPNLVADFYSGKVNGEIFLDYAHQMSYSITIHFAGVDLSRLKSVNRDVFSQVQGHVDGDAKLTGDLKSIGSIEAALGVPLGGKLKASLLGFIVQYIPQSTQRKDLELLIKTNGDVPFEKGNIRLKSLSNDKLATEISLNSEKFNLDLNLGVDINIEGGLANLLRHAGDFTK